ncbi:MAG: hypothetical protein H8E74_01205 [Gammaproteobacteria bacterium]|nr:hypothetical protein [Gammaproteobacteria bacterium]
MAQPTYPHTITKDYAWWIDRGQIAIAYAKDTPSGDRLLSDGSYNSMDGIRERSYTGEWLSPHESVTIRVFCIKKAEVLTESEKLAGTAASGKFTSTGMDDVPEFPSQFHRALVYYVISKGYENNPELIKLSEVFEAKYRNKKDEAHRYVGGNRFYGAKQVKTNPGWGIM